MRYKLSTYSLNDGHAFGGPKARGFEAILGISIEAVDYLEAELRTGILNTPISSIRNNQPHGLNCVVEVPIRGLGDKDVRVVPVRTIWEITGRDARPRLVNAFPKN
jgi:hypothetical protein